MIIEREIHKELLALSGQYIRYNTKHGIVVIPDHGFSKDLQTGTENSILKQAGLK